MLNLMKSDVTLCQDSVLSYLDAQLYLGQNVSYKFILSVLKLVKKVGGTCNRNRIVRQLDLRHLLIKKPAL